jgi:hypothetical protein
MFSKPSFPVFAIPVATVGLIVLLTVAGAALDLTIPVEAGRPGELVVTGWLWWSLGPGLVGLLTAFYVRWLIRRRYYDATQIRDDSVSPVAPGPAEARLIAKLELLGLRYAGELLCVSAVDQSRVWVYVDPTDMIRAEVSPRPARCFFTSDWPDGTYLVTTQTRWLRMTSSRGKFQSAKTLDAGYRLHVQTMQARSSAVGWPAQTQSMDHVVAMERYEWAEARDSVLHHLRWRQHAFFLTIIVVASLNAILFRPW